MARGIAACPVINKRMDALLNWVPLQFKEDNLDVDTIVFQSGNTIRYTFNSSPDLSEIVLGRDLTVNSATNASNNGNFVITAVDDTAKHIDVTNPGRSDSTDDEATDSPATGGTIEHLTVPSVANQGSLFVEKILEVPFFTDEDGESVVAPVISGLTNNNTDGSNPTAPAAGTFSVNYQTGELIFNSAEAGNSFKVDYYGKGSLVEAEEINDFCDRLDRGEANGNNFTTTAGEDDDDDGGDPFLETASSNYKAMFRVPFGGTDNSGTPSGSEIIVNNSSGSGSTDVRIVDLTNSVVIAEKTGITVTVATLVNLGVLSNLPAAKAVWEIQVKQTVSGNSEISGFRTLF